MAQAEQITYEPLPTLKAFHQCDNDIRCVVGPVGSGKTSAATWEICYFLPHHLNKKYGIKKTKWCIVRNTYNELIDTTQRTIFDWFPLGDYKDQKKIYKLYFPDGIEVELLFRSCDRPEDVAKFKSLELTGYWIDESIEVKEEIKMMLKNRIGRFPAKCARRYGVETTNPPDIEHPTYFKFNWGDTPPPGPIPESKPLENHRGFWQPPNENTPNLREGYYDDLRKDYADNPDWVALYVEGKPGTTVQGKLVYNRFIRKTHVATGPLIWSKGTLFAGWDNSGNYPACVVCQMPYPGHVQVLREYTQDNMGIVDFTRWVVADRNERYPKATWVEWADPAGFNRFSKKDGGLTSNSEMMMEMGVEISPSDNNWAARREAVEKQMSYIDGCLIDGSCNRLISGFLGGYCYKEIGTTGIFQDKPMKNKFSHIHDALQYCMMGMVDGSHKKPTKSFYETMVGKKFNDLGMVA